MYKKKIAGILLLFVLACSTASAQTDEPDRTDRPAGVQRHLVGIGVGFGSLFGINLKLLPLEPVALEAGAGWVIGPAGGLQVYADGHFNWLRFRGSSTDWQVFAGIGGRINLGGTAGFRAGARVPFGVEMSFRRSSIGLYARTVPTIDLLGEMELNWYGEAGIRWLF